MVVVGAIVVRRVAVVVIGQTSPKLVVMPLNMIRFRFDNTAIGAEGRVLDSLGIMYVQA